MACMLISELHAHINDQKNLSESSRKGTRILTCFSVLCEAGGYSDHA